MKTITVISLLLMTGCGRNTTPSDYKLAGVGLDPDEISPSPKMYGGLISYDYVEFGGGSLPLALVGLNFYDSSGPGISTFKPPYAMVTGTAFFFEQDAPAPNVLFGNVSVAPAKVGTCHTIYEPRSFLSGIADAGAKVSLKTLDGSGIEIGRRPLFYPPDLSGIFPYYMGLEVYKPNDRIWRDTNDLVSLDNWDNAAYATNNFPFEQAVDVSFPGAVTPENATFGTIPVPYSASQQGVSHLLPSKPSGVMVSWTGPQYSTDGIVTDANSTERKTCMQYAAGDEPPTTTDDCVEYTPLAPPDGEKYDSGQMYTAPWETDDGVVTLSWKPNTVNANETVSISVRFLGEIDETKDAFVEEVIPVQKTSYAQSSWDSAISDGEIPEGTECPEVGYRAALPCDPDEDIEYIFDESLRKGSGYISSLQGDPTRPLVEVTCNVEDNGSFEISQELLSGAMDYARQHNAQGAVFYINRTTTSELSVPDVRDRIGSRRVTGPILVSTNAVQFGRFWYNPSAVGGE